VLRLRHMAAGVGAGQETPPAVAGPPQGDLGSVMEPWQGPITGGDPGRRSFFELSMPPVVGLGALPVWACGRRSFTGELTQKSDVYSFGIVLLETLAIRN